MAGIKCEICGGTDIVKYGNLFICQQCGTKYSLESVREIYQNMLDKAAPQESGSDQNSFEIEREPESLDNEARSAVFESIQEETEIDHDSHEQDVSSIESENIAAEYKATYLPQNQEECEMESEAVEYGEALVEEDTASTDSGLQDEGYAVEINQKQKKPLCVMSLIAFIVSLLAFGTYALILGLKRGDLLIGLDILAVVSLVLPPIAKKARLLGDKSGRGFEIAAIVVGGYAFAMAIFFMPKVSMYFGYLGWIVGGLVYKYTGREYN